MATNEKRDTGSDSQGSLPLSKIKISRWNGSSGQLDDTHVAALQEDIEKQGLLQPIVLVRDGEGYAVVAGAHRFQALVNQRGNDGVLQLHEYRVFPGLTEEVPRCADVSVHENGLRRGLSVRQLANFIARLIDIEKQTREQVAEMLKLNLATVSRLKTLPAVFNKLPKGWRDDLGMAARCDSNHAVAITQSHWAAVSATVEKLGVTPELRKILESAHVEQWSVKQLDHALEGFKARKELKVPASPEPPAPADDQSGCAATPAPAVQPNKPAAPVKPPTPMEFGRQGMAHLAQARQAFTRAGPALQDLVEFTTLLIQRVEESLAELATTDQGKNAA